MTDNRGPIDKLFESLQERAKELNCLYAIEEILNRPGAALGDVCRAIIEAIPAGWQYSEICQARIELFGEQYEPAGFRESPWAQQADLIIQDQKVGALSVFYQEQMPAVDDGPFLKEEAQLIKTIANRLEYYIGYRQMRHAVMGVERARAAMTRTGKGEWRCVIDLLRATDHDLHLRIAQKMLNHLCWSGIRAAQDLLGASQPVMSGELASINDQNRPHSQTAFTLSDETGKKLFDIADEHIRDAEILNIVQKWIQEDKMSFLVQVVNRHLTLPVVADALRRYHHMGPAPIGLHSPARRGVEVALIRRFLSDQLDVINIAKDYIGLPDFYQLIENLVYTTDSHGKLGGKSAGLYLAKNILQKSEDPAGVLAGLKIPKTWHITSDVLLYFMHYNDLDDVVEQKYKEIDQVRQEYPHIVRMFKSSRFPADIVKGLSMALDDFGDRPLIVRSSSLLEDRMGAAFSGKYKSLFLANQGTKEERLAALTDAIAEVYASTFGPDPIEYRAERGLIDFGEEMGIMIQEVVGSRVGDYFLPTFAGVAFSRNEFRWSPRIKRLDGLLRLVPGLGTRAVDRLSDDYPVLMAPGQPNLRVNATVDEVLRYAPKMIDLINLSTNNFETVDAADFLEKHGADIPGINDVISWFVDGRLRQPLSINLGPEPAESVVTFAGLAADTKFIKSFDATLKLLEEKLSTPVDIEFAFDGRDLYLLQCRPQSQTGDTIAAPIPQDVPPERTVFSANRYVSNGRVSNITHIVYVDPREYGKLTAREDLLAVGQAVGKLNKLLPKRQFILMGPGRWGSRGDIKLGVNVTYSAINNAAVLIEIARQQGNYVPDLSFGTHFFQDLVEANIRYLPLYPDDEGVVFNERFLTQSPNILAELVPEYAQLSETIRLIDVVKSTAGLTLQILMNADLSEALAILTDPQAADQTLPVQQQPVEQPTEHYWRWRLQMAQQIAAQLDPEQFDVEGFYIFGSAKNATAGPASDIDILIHFRGTPAQQERLLAWLNGWSLCLDEVNYLQTGYRSGGLLDVYLVTDQDIADQTSYAIKIGAVTDAARLLPMKNRPVAPDKH
ncbi:PEP/pyruvate-binding domain-containing protein [Candidatus Zixiibacteriota bacterium]